MAGWEFANKPQINVKIKGDNIQSAELLSHNKTKAKCRAISIT